MISIIKTNSYLLSQQMKSIEQEFLKEGGIRERMTRARINYRNNK
ncbi:MAG: four helix bundle suffix domain-containing protein [Pseudomonadota bacterium]